MHEFFKGLCILVLLVGLIVAALAWNDDKPDQRTWITRIAAPSLAAAAMGVFVVLHFRRDRAPDFLYQQFGGFFDRGGLCFAFAIACQEGVCLVQAYFQNRFARSCQARIALRPARGFFGRFDFQSIGFDVDCPGAAFGVAQVAVPIPRSFQGEKQIFEVGASVIYPNGKGRMLRFRDGAIIRSNAKFVNAFGTALTAAGALGGAIVISKPATATLCLPIGVAEELPADLVPSVTILWTPGGGPSDAIRANEHRRGV